MSLKDLYYHYRENGGTPPLTKSTFKYNMKSNGFSYKVFSPTIDGKQVKKRGFFGLKPLVSNTFVSDAYYLLFQSLTIEKTDNHASNYTDESNLS